MGQTSTSAPDLQVRPVDSVQLRCFRRPTWTSAADLEVCPTKVDGRRASEKSKCEEQSQLLSLAFQFIGLRWLSCDRFRLMFADTGSALGGRAEQVQPLRRNCALPLARGSSRREFGRP